MSTEIEDLKDKIKLSRENLIGKRSQLKELQTKKESIIAKYIEEGKEEHLKTNVSDLYFLRFDPFRRHNSTCNCHKEGDNYLMDQFDFSMTSIQLKQNEVQTQIKQNICEIRRLLYRLKKISNDSKN